MAATSHSEILAAHRFAKKEKDKMGDSHRIREYTDANLKAPDGKPFCVECQTVFWACSRNKLYPPAPTAVEQRPAKKEVVIMAWFLAQIFCLDVDPEDGKRTMPAAKLIHVYKWYLEDVETWPNCYLETTYKWFTKVWANHFPHVVCRKWLRFAKCTLCVALRTIIGNRKLGRDERKKAAAQLSAHYKAMKMERAYHRQ